MTNKKTQYSFKIGIGKTVKNILVTYALPAILYLANGAAEWMPKEKALALTPVLGALCYLLKNYLKNR